MNEPRMHDDVKLLLSAVALGTATDDELRSVEEHVAACAVCEEQLIEFRETVGMLHAVALPVAPPVDLKERVMQQIVAETHASRVNTQARSEVRRWRIKPIMFGGASLAAAAAVLAIMLPALNHQASQAVRRGPSSALLQVHVAPGADTSIRRVAMRLTGTQIHVQGLPAPVAGHAWQLWAVDAKGVAHSLQVMSGSGDASVPRSATLVAVTDEPSGGSAQPTSAPVASARV